MENNRELGLACKKKANPDFIFLDKMPVMDGKTISQAIRSDYGA